MNSIDNNPIIKVLLLSQESQFDECNDIIQGVRKIMGHQQLIKIKNKIFKISISYSDKVEEKNNLFIPFKIPDNDILVLREKAKVDNFEIREIGWGQRLDTATFISIYDYLVKIAYSINIDETNPVVLVMGCAGVGKSSVLNLIEPSFNLPVGQSDRGVTRVPTIKELKQPKYDFIDTPGLSELIGGTYSSDEAMKLILGVFEYIWTRLDIIFWVIEYGRLKKDLEDVNLRIKEMLLKDPNIQVVLIITHFDNNKITTEVLEYIKNVKSRLGLPDSNHVLTCSKCVRELLDDARAAYRNRREDSRREIFDILDAPFKQIRIHTPNKAFLESLLISTGLAHVGRNILKINGDLIRLNAGITTLIKGDVHFTFKKEDDLTYISYDNRFKLLDSEIVLNGFKISVHRYEMFDRYLIG